MHLTIINLPWMPACSSERPKETGPTLLDAVAIVLVGAFTLLLALRIALREICRRALMLWLMVDGVPQDSLYREKEDAIERCASVGQACRG